MYRESIRDGRGGRPSPQASFPGAAAEALSFPDPSLNAVSVEAKAFLFVDESSRRLLREMERVGPSGASVLVQGETGTGKELVARRLHELGGRKGPFVAVNCAALPESLVEAELFGHEVGAFTGASEARAGWFEAANGGTLFLDEIGDLPLSAQAKLLRVLQEREVVRLGARHGIPLDVRLISATNIELSRAVSAGRFRMDLYYRIDIATLVLLPLRERPDDVEPLARHFLKLHAFRMSVPEPELPLETLLALRRYAWPGNVRELENVVHYALLIGRDGCIRPSDLRFAGVCAPGTRDSPRPVPASEALDRALERLVSAPSETPIHGHVEKRLLEIAFLQFDRNQVRTAHGLGLSRNVLRTLLKRHGLIESETGAAPRNPRGAGGTARGGSFPASGER